MIKLKRGYSFSFLFLWTQFCWSQLPEKLSSDYQLVWQDEFEGNVLDSSNWNHRFVGSLRGNARVSAENSFLNGKGQLVIQATQQDTNYFVGAVSTTAKRLFQYGYFEARVQLTSQVGTETAFWIQSPVYGKFGGDPKVAGAEIDILEYRSLHPKEVHHAVHWNGYEKAHKQKSKDIHGEEMENGAYHTFGVEWTKGAYTFYIDGEKSWTTRKGISRIKQYIILSVEMIDWCGDPKGSSFPDRALFDYVRVYQLIE